ncbi:competence protein ComEC [Dendrosporobacter quercicolus]|uniref:Competence protein ComEC n=2 Tax=Dendrosporobacter quercicolus TaxID=146817 RepID=A0A1G9Y8K3_9FIRM|nr:competence protein ComEC [Dendrosporobacter quercicolus]
MKNYKIGLGLLIVLIVAFFAGCSNNNQQFQAASSPVPKQITIQMIDVGQGDAILIRTAEQVILIDTGDVAARAKLIRFLKQQGIGSIDKVIISHPHADHLGGMAELVANFTVKQVYDSGQPTTTALYRRYLATIKQKNIPFTILAAGDQVDFGNGAVFKVLGPRQPFISEEALNNNSIAGKLVYGRFSLLFTGDVEKQAEERLRQSYPAELAATVLKSPHHGSRTSSSPPFLRAVAPEAVIISVGADNEYKHPHKATLKKYADCKARVYRTDQDGTITITSDGQSYQIVKER